MKMNYKQIFEAVCSALAISRRGLVLGALAADVDKLDGIPEFQRAWYQEDPVTKKFKLDLTKVDVEDVAGLKATVAATRKEKADMEAASKRAVAEALKAYEGIDPVKTRELLSQFASDEERQQIQAGHIDVVISKRMEKEREDLIKKTEEAQRERDGALEVASTFMERVLDNHVRAAASGAGMHPSAIEDALLRARQIFSLNDDGEAVQFEEDGETPKLGKDGKTPFTPSEWIEGMKEKAPHWFPSGATGGGAPGGGKNMPRKDMSGMSPQQRITAAREAGQK